MTTAPAPVTLAREPARPAPRPTPPVESLAVLAARLAGTLNPHKAWATRLSPSVRATVAIAPHKAAGMGSRGLRRCHHAAKAGCTCARALAKAGSVLVAVLIAIIWRQNYPPQRRHTHLPQQHERSTDDAGSVRDGSR